MVSNWQSERIKTAGRDAGATFRNCRFIAKVAFLSALFVVAAFLVSDGSAVLAEDGSSVAREIKIESDWGGLGPSQHTEVIVRRKNGKYYRGHKSVDPRLVEELVSALKQPAVKEPDFVNLGVTPQWRKENAVRAAVKARENFVDGAQNQQDLYVKSFNDDALMGKVLTGMFRTIRTDDYPSVKVEVTLEDGSVLTAMSHSWDDFMLPWGVSGNEGGTFNADISRAVAALMPKKATNRERLAGEGFDADLAEAVLRYIEKDWKLLDAENKLGSALEEIRREYDIESAEINPYHHPEYGVEWDSKRPHETNLHAVLHRKNAPPDYVVALTLRVTNNRAEGVEQFLRESQKYETAPLCIPWLADYVRGRPPYPVRVAYVHDKSFSDKALRVFTNDMHAIGRDDLAEEAKKRQAEITLLMTGLGYHEGYWLVYPDKHLVLWRYGARSGLLKWTQNDFPASRCSEYQEVTGGCVGATVNPDGSLAKNASNSD
jgi:hypothetical protein